MSVTLEQLTTVEDLMRLPEDGRRHELTKGELLTMTPAGGRRLIGLEIGRCWLPI